MNNSSRSYSGRLIVLVRPGIWAMLIAAFLLAAACGGESHSNGQVSTYAAGSKTEEDVDRELKFDARVQDYEAQGDKLVVNVNQSFVASPPGIQQRAVGHWFGLWQATRTPENSKPPKGLEVLVRHEGTDLARWTGGEGFKPVGREKAKDEDDGDAEAESE